MMVRLWLKKNDTTKKTLKRFLHDNVAKGSVLSTDQHKGYAGMNKWYDHKTVNHNIGQYVKGIAHTIL